MRKRNGQSIIEYTVLAMLIIVGTIVMGPYVIRSIGAHFKLWQETVDDSVNDRLKTTPLHVSGVCNHSTTRSSGCGAPLKQGSPMCANEGLNLPARNCAADERYYYQSGTPDGCWYCEGCKHDDTCCDVFNACISAPCCGKKTLPAVGFKRSNFIKDAAGKDTIELPSVDRDGTSTHDGSSPYGSNDYRDQGIPNNQSCYYGEMLLYNNCDNNRIRCQINTKCDPHCIGNLPVNSLGTTTGHLCDPNPEARLLQDEKVSWYEPCPEPPPPIPGPPVAGSSMQVFYRSTGAMELYASDEKWTKGALLSMPFKRNQCDDTPKHLSTWETIFGVLGFGGSGTYECLFWLGPLFCYHRIPLPAPSVSMAFDHGYWGCTRSDDPTDMSWSSGFITLALDILFGFGGGSLAGSAISQVLVGYTAAVIGSSLGFDQRRHPDSDWNWNGCGVKTDNSGSYDRHKQNCKGLPGGMNVYRKMTVSVKPGGTAYLYATIAEDSGQPFFTFAPFTGDHFGMFEVFVQSGGKNYCFKPTTQMYSRDSVHGANGPDIKDPSDDSCKYLVVHGNLEMDVNSELLRLEIPPGDEGGDDIPIRYNCSTCSGKCGPAGVSIANLPACRAKCDTGYSEILVPDPDNPGNNIVTCIPCDGLKCNYTIDCKQGGLPNASTSFIGATCDSNDTLIGCIDKGTGSGHGATAISNNGCYATRNFPTNNLAATDITQYGCQLSCHKPPAGLITQCTDGL